MALIGLVGLLASPSLAQPDGSSFAQTEYTYLSLIIDTLDAAFVSDQYRVSEEIERRQSLLLARPALVPPETIAGVLVAKGACLRRAIELYSARPGYFEFLARCASMAYVNASEEYRAADLPEAEITMFWPVPPPPGYPAGVDPDDIDEDDARAVYTERLSAFYEMQRLSNAKKDAERRLKRTTKSCRRFAEQVKRSQNPELVDRFVTILTELGGLEAVSSLMPNDADDRD